MLLALLIAPGLSHARDMQGRLGVGYNSEFGAAGVVGGIPAISVKYGLTRDIGAQAVAGFFTGAVGQTAFAIRGFKNMIFENNMNFYFMIGIGLVSANSATGIEAQGGLGAEFFMPGLESLGFAFEAGVTYGNSSGTYALRSLAASFINAGIHFYF